MIINSRTITQEEAVLRKKTFEELVNLYLSGKTKIHIIRQDAKIGFKSTENDIATIFNEYDARVNKVINELNRGQKVPKIIRVVNELTTVTIIIEFPSQFLDLGFYLQGSMLRCTIEIIEDPY